jgi:hypothetical protein
MKQKTFTLGPVKVTLFVGAARALISLYASCAGEPRGPAEMSTDRAEHLEK